MNSSDSVRNARIISFLIAFGFLLSLAVRVYLTAIRRFDADEFEHIHASWMIYAGYLPYRDFWQNHTPLLYYAMTPIIYLFGESISTIFIVRALLSAFSFVILWLTYLLARLDHDRLTSVLSVLILSCSYLFLHKTIEIRPDHLLVAPWLASVFLAIRYRSKAVVTLLAGALLGIGMLATPKALLCLNAAFLLFALKYAVLNRADGWFQMVRESALYLLGFLIPFGACAAFFHSQGVLRLFLDSNVTENLYFPYARKLAYLQSVRYSLMFVISAAGVAICFYKRNWFSGYGSRLLIGVMMAFLIFLFFFVLPASSPQTALIFLPFMAIYGGIAFKESIDWYYSDRKAAGKALLALVVLSAIVVPCISAIYEKSTTPTNKGQMEMIGSILKTTRRGDVFFDGNIGYVFQPQTYYYGSLIEEIVQKIEKGDIRLSIPESLKRKQCKFVIYDERVARLPEPILNFLRNNYMPSEIQDVHVAGKLLPPENISDRGAKFRIEIPLVYTITANECGQFHIDGQVYSGPVFLDTGAHDVVCDKRLQSVLIRAM